MQVQNLKPKACYKMIVTDEASAKIMLKDVIQFLGMAFHPDNCGMDYEDVATEKPTFEEFEAEMLDANINKAIELMGDNIYTYSMGVWHEFGMITDEYYKTLTGE